jgi:hypothetical protein
VNWHRAGDGAAGVGDGAAGGEEALGDDVSGAGMRVQLGEEMVSGE